MWSQSIRIGFFSRSSAKSSVLCGKRTFSGDVKSKRIGLVGMGHVGDAVLHNLRRNGFTVSAISDKFIDKCTGRFPSEIPVMKTSREVAENSDIVVTGLPKPPDVKDCFEGADGLLAGLRQDSVWIDHSTTDYGQNLAFDEALKEKGAHLLEAPITGGLDALKRGQMAVWVAGEKDAYTYTKPVFDASYSTVMYTGGIGTAMIPKVVSNMLCCVQVVAMGEMLMLAKRSGLDLKTFWHAIRASAGNSFLWETAGPNIFRGDYHESFALELQVKDIQLCYDMAKKAKVPTELIGAMHQIYNRALYQLGPDVGCYAPPRLLEEALKEDLRAPGFEKWTYDIENVEGALHIRHKGVDLKMDESEKQNTKV